MTNTIIFLVLLVHAVGHLQGVFIAVNKKDFGKWHSQSWILKKGLSTSKQRMICLALFLITFFLLLMAALSFKGILIEQTLWVQLSFIGAVFSSSSIILFPNGLAMLFNKAGAILVNLLIFYTFIFSSSWIELIS